MCRIAKRAIRLFVGSVLGELKVLDLEEYIVLTAVAAHAFQVHHAVRAELLQLTVHFKS